MAGVITKPLLNSLSRGRKEKALKEILGGRSCKTALEEKEIQKGATQVKNQALKGALWLKEDVKEGPGDLLGKTSSGDFFF